MCPCYIWVAWCRRSSVTDTSRHESLATFFMGESGWMIVKYMPPASKEVSFHRFFPQISASAKWCTTPKSVEFGNRVTLYKIKIIHQKTWLLVIRMPDFCYQTDSPPPHRKTNSSIHVFRIHIRPRNIKKQTAWSMSSRCDGPMGFVFRLLVFLFYFVRVLMAARVVNKQRKVFFKVALIWDIPIYPPLPRFSMTTRSVTCSKDSKDPY